jgi:hypothetical protein
MKSQKAVTNHQKLENRQRPRFALSTASPMLCLAGISSRPRLGNGTESTEVSLIANHSSGEAVASHAGTQDSISNSARFIPACSSFITSVNFRAWAGV